MTPEGPEEERGAYDDAVTRERAAKEAGGRDSDAEEARRLNDAHQGEASRAREVADSEAESREASEPQVRDRNTPDPDAKTPEKPNAPSETSRPQADESEESKSKTAATSEESVEKAEADKRKRLLGIRGSGESGADETLSVVSIEGADGEALKSRKESAALKGGAVLSSGVAVRPTGHGETETASTAAGADKGTKGDGEDGPRQVRGNAGGAQAAKGSAALSAREVPRGPLENGSRKGMPPESDQDSQGDKDAGKNAIRTTVISRHRRSGDSDGSGGRQAVLQDAPGRSDLPFVKESSDGARIDTPALDAGRPGPATGNTSSLEGGRDLAPRHLQQQLKDFATGDVVRHARFVLKENAGGEIRLLLKPEQLGTVRVRLEVQDNRIAGRIIVENTTVRDAFEQTLSDLQRAFREAGLETGSLEVTVGEDGQASGRQPTAQGRRVRAIAELAESVPTLLGELDEPRMINVYA